MKYKIHDKVETPYGVGTIHMIDTNKGDEEKLFWVSLNGLPEISFSEEDLKPYKSAHKKLEELGFVQYTWGSRLSYGHEVLRTLVYIYPEQKMFDVSGEFRQPVMIDLQLAKILTQYLEEL